MLEHYIRGSNKPVSVDHCVIQAMYQQHKSDPTLFLQLARLAAIFFLKAGDVVAEVLHLSLGPIQRWQGSRSIPRAQTAGVRQC